MSDFQSNPYSTARQAHYVQRSSLLTSFPPSLPRDGHPQTSCPRPGVPLLLTNALPSPLGTPLSTVSSYGPFPRSQPQSPGPSPMAATTMSSRATLSYAAPYDPREWVGGSRRTSMIEHHGNEAEEGITNPPPPYSGPSIADPTPAAGISAGSTLSPADSTFTGDASSQVNTPTSTVGFMSPLHSGHTVSSETGQRTNPQANAQHFTSSLNRPSTFGSRGPRLGVVPPPGESRPGDPTLTITRQPIQGPLSIASPPSGTTYVQGPIRHSGVVPVPGPPAARRAASAGAVSSHGSQPQDVPLSRPSSRQGSWYPGMPLPGPPPGPPPSSSRSQSASGMNNASSSRQTAHNGRAYHRVSRQAPLLSPMPPTPANWREGSTSRSGSRAPPPLQIVTTNLDKPESSTAGLSRSAALRVSSAKGLLERRKHRRSVHEESLTDFSALTIDTDLWFEGSGPRDFGDINPRDLESASSSVASPSFGLNTTTPIQQQLRGATDVSHGEIPSRLNNFAPTNPFSPRSASSVLPQKALPTPPLSQKNPLSAHSVLPSTASSLFEILQGDSDSFIADASRRHHEFLIRESQAKSDLERLALFGEFICAESRVRRERYPGPFTDGSFKPEIVKAQLFQDGFKERVETDVHNNLANAAGQPHAYNLKAGYQSRADSTWWKDYRPALSPIASMSHDGISSRGRTASRWWQSQTGDDDSQGVGAGKKVKRSKRESKYMGLPELTLDEVLSGNPTPTGFQDVSISEAVEGEDKGGFATLGYYDDQYQPVATVDPTPDYVISPHALDISRFITLPPPYPRHYPAVNNTHPKLAASRNIVRTLSQLTELEDRRSRHNLSVEALRSEHKRKIQERQQTFKVNIQAQIGDGSITFAEAAEAEHALKLEEHRREKQCLQAEFDTLQDVVITPMHDMLNTRLEQLDKSIVELTNKLAEETQVENLDRPQQEGDATPETLEYLTQLKWLFEAREQIHQEIYNLLSERNEKYKAIVLLPYRQGAHHDKIRDTEEFFHRDSLQRKTTFRKESVSRHETLLKLIEEHVRQEVVVQLSAFWDIAPGLLDLVQKLSDDVEHMRPIAIPAAEYDENPSYHDYPLQYLYTLLDHAETSTYQFIESQTNLYCLLHEARLGVLKSRCRAAEAGQAQSNSHSPSDVDNPVKIRQKAETEATAELKQQVAMVEEQWSEALGNAFQAKKAMIKGYLEATGGWDESIQVAV